MLIRQVEADWQKWLRQLNGSIECSLPKTLLLTRERSVSCERLWCIAQYGVADASVEFPSQTLFPSSFNPYSPFQHFRLPYGVRVWVVRALNEILIGIYNRNSTARRSTKWCRAWRPAAAAMWVMASSIERRRRSCTCSVFDAMSSTKSSSATVWA